MSNGIEYRTKIDPRFWQKSQAIPTLHRIRTFRAAYSGSTLTLAGRDRQRPTTRTNRGNIDMFRSSSKLRIEGSPNR